FLFVDEEELLPLSAGDLTHKKLPSAAALSAFRQALDFVREADPYDLSAIEEAIIEIGQSHTENGKAGPLLGRMRLAVTRQKVSPPLFESMLALGRERTAQRLEQAVRLLAESVEIAGSQR
ncbi:MAG: hypothetical protein ACOC8X_11010, partial [Chloroflexota bacterium]